MTSPQQPPADRIVHPLAWWAWALGLAFAVGLTTNPLLLLLLAGAVTAVVLLRRSDAPWARSVGAYFVLAGVILVIRVLFQVVIGADHGDTVLFTLPEVPLPDWAAGIRLGGEVTAEALAWTLYDALRLGVMLICLGAANALANPRQALRSVPAALYEVSVAVVIAFSVAPQLIASGRRVGRARRLRGGTTRGLSAATAIVVPVLQDAVERSIALAAGMETRGFGRSRAAPDRLALAVLLGSMMVATLGGFLVLGSNVPLPGAAALGLGVSGTIWGLRRAGRRLQVTRYRPNPWRRRDTVIAACGALVVAVILVLGVADPGALNPSTDPLHWPALEPMMLLAAAVALAPVLFSGPVAAGPVDVPEPGGRRVHPRPRAAEVVPA